MGVRGPRAAGFETTLRDGVMMVSTLAACSTGGGRWVRAEMLRGFREIGEIRVALIVSESAVVPDRGWAKAI
ncbi:MAG: hypothetical protein DWQ29_09395 [Planctomycetota bacterium]|nr:MAG: hypothetical protein DWQ29_09395 [Planctomycetota bacterium]